MNVTMIGLDTAKSVFQVHGVDTTGRAQLKRKLRRLTGVGKKDIDPRYLSEGDHIYRHAAKH